MSDDRKKRRRKSSQGTPWGLILGILGGVGVCVLLACGGIIYFLVSPARKAAEEAREEAKVQATLASITALDMTIDLYKIDQGGFPESLEELMTPADGRSLALLDRIPKDIWGEPLNYEYPSTKTGSIRPAIWSNGPNRQNENGSGDDINGWEQDGEL
ncbi:MAG: type II secretion system protein GspG [Planctomycetaceae bacterium]